MKSSVIFIIIIAIITLIVWISLYGGIGGDKNCVPKEQDKIMEENYRKFGPSAYSSTETQSAYYQAKGVCGVR